MKEEQVRGAVASLELLTPPKEETLSKPGLSEAQAKEENTSL